MSASGRQREGNRLPIKIIIAVSVGLATSDLSVVTSVWWGVATLFTLAHVALWVDDLVEAFRG
jgi:hypothetical protein